MTLIQKIKTYFIKNDFHRWKNFSWDDHQLNFEQLTEETLLDIGSFIKSDLKPSKQIGNKRHRLHEKSAYKCQNLDSLLPLISSILSRDYNETTVEAAKYNWEFRYFVTYHERCENTIRICNALRMKEGQQGNCIYPLATIRKFDGNYYCWNHAN